MTVLALDATPLLGPRTGIGVYTSHLIRGLSTGPFETVATAMTWRGQAGLDVVVPQGVPVRSKAAPARALRELWKVTDHPKLERLTGPVDIFHATNFVLPPLRSARGVLTIHDLAYLRFPAAVEPQSLAYRELVPRGLQRCSVVCTPTRAVADQVMDAYAVDEAKIVVTPLGVDEAWFSAQPPDQALRCKHGLADEYILAFGTLEPRKNISALVRAYRDCLSRRIAMPQLVLAGGTGWGEDLDLASLPEGMVRRTGRLADQEARRLVAGASLFVLPSLDEGFGLTALEAMACGVPVLANDLPVTREVLGNHAAFCDATNQVLLAEALATEVAGAVSTPDLRRERASQFTWDRTVAATIGAYQLAEA